MAVFSRWTRSLAALSLLATGSTAAGQVAAQSAAAPMFATTAALPHPAATPAPPPAAAPGQFTQGQLAAGRYTEPAIAAPQARSLPPVKPFQTEFERPTVSPYLQLHREDLDGTLPNYFAFVRPQIQQQELLEQQRTELQTIHRRLQQSGRQAATAGAGSAPGTAGPPATYHARFLNTGGYFSGVPLPQQQLGQNQ